MGPTRVIALRIVVLPAPLGPMIDRISPAFTSKSTMCTAWTPPKWTHRRSTVNTVCERSVGATPCSTRAGTGGREPSAANPSKGEPSDDGTTAGVRRPVTRSKQRRASSCSAGQIPSGMKSIMSMSNRPKMAMRHTWTTRSTSGRTVKTIAPKTGPINVARPPATTITTMAIVRSNARISGPRNWKKCA